MPFGHISLAGKTTLHEPQVGGARQPSLDVLMIIVCGLGASKLLWLFGNVKRSREWALEADEQLDASGVAWFVGRLSSVHRATAPET